MIMKKWAALLLCIAMVLGACGCAEYEQLTQSIQQAAQAVDSGTTGAGSTAEKEITAPTEAPVAEEPEKTDKPEETEAPANTVKPEETAQPEESAKPVETQAPAKTAEPTVEPSATPVQMSKTPTEIILEYFTELAAIPRASHHEEAISDYIYSWGVMNALSTQQDENGNVIIDLPASTGCENAPLTVLQAHMDMVAVAEEGKQFNILSDGIKPKRIGNILSADGTSLGADDGIGVAAAMYILSDETLSHGPIRAIFTVNEEDGMSGAEKLDTKHLEDAVYLINLDNEQIDQALIGCAYGSIYTMNFTPAWKAPEGDTAYEITVYGLLGGHSGICINMGRANAIKHIAGILAGSFNEGMMPEIAAISGGTANNAIPGSATVTVVIRDADTEAFEKIVTEQRIADEERYGKVETGAVFNCTRLNTLPDRVLYGPIGRSLTEFLFLCPDGINTMSMSEANEVESSSNLGVVKLDDKELSATVYTRSSRKCVIEEQEAKLKLLCAMSECNMRQIAEMPGWTPDEENLLASMAAEIYQAQTGKEMKIESVHAGLECGWLVAKNPKLQCISIGPNIHDPHTTKENVELDSIAIFEKLLQTMLARIAAE